MKYQEFICAIAQHQTARVKALNIPGSSAPDAIPEIFKILFPDIIQIIDKHFNELADGLPFIGIFGFQPAGFTVHSKTDQRKELCCVIYYRPLHSLDKTNDWRNHKSIVVDFSKGIVIDEKHYLHSLIHKGEKGTIYGKINSEKLTYAWREYALAEGF